MMNSTINEKAKEIINERDCIIASERDSQIFFDAITNPKQPSESLKNVLKDYNAFEQQYPIEPFFKKNSK